MNTNTNNDADDLLPDDAEELALEAEAEELTIEELAERLDLLGISSPTAALELLPAADLVARVVRAEAMERAARIEMRAAQDDARRAREEAFDRGGWWFGGVLPRSLSEPSRRTDSTE